MTRHPNPPPIPSNLQNPPNRGTKRGIKAAIKTVPSTVQANSLPNQEKNRASTQPKSPKQTSSHSDEVFHPTKINRYSNASSQFNATEEDFDEEMMPQEIPSSTDNKTYQEPDTIPKHEGDDGAQEKNREPWQAKQTK